MEVQIIFKFIKVFVFYLCVYFCIYFHEILVYGFLFL